MQFKYVKEKLGNHSIKMSTNFTGDFIFSGAFFNS